MRRFAPLLATLLALLAGGCATRTALTDMPAFSAAADLARWTLDGSGQWEIRDGMLVLAQKGTPAGAIRRPSALAILEGPPLRRATIRTGMRSTAPQTTLNRDLEVIFGYESPTRFYYVHLSGITDAAHNGIFLVADADRRRVDDGTAPPQLRDVAWHDVRVERDGDSGLIEVYVDGAATPSLRAVDTTIRSGRVGVGSFDDTGEFRGFSVTGH